MAPRSPLHILCGDGLASACGQRLGVVENDSPQSGSFATFSGGADGKELDFKLSHRRKAFAGAVQAAAAPLSARIALHARTRSGVAGKSQLLVHAWQRHPSERSAPQNRSHNKRTRYSSRRSCARGRPGPEAGRTFISKAGAGRGTSRSNHAFCRKQTRCSCVAAGRDFSIRLSGVRG